MGTLSSLVESFGKLFRRRSDHFDPSTLEVYDIDIDEVYERLGLAAKAKKNGTQNIPPADSTVPDGAEQEVITEAEGKIRNGITQANTVVMGLDASSAKVDTADLLQKIRGVSRDLSLELKTTMASGQLSLVSARKVYETATDEYNRFRRESQIDREPHYPDSYLWRWSFLVLLLIACCLLNAQFFRDALPTGFVGGVFYAFICGVIDITVSFTMGRWTPWHTQPEGWHRRAGKVAIVFFAIWAPFWNLAVGHLREQAQMVAVLGNSGTLTAMNEAAILAASSFLANPFGLDDLLSWMFVILGFILSCAAFLDGLRWDDPIPGYRDVHKRQAEALLDYQYEYEELKEAGEKRRETESTRLQTLEASVSKGITTLHEIISTKATWAANLHQFIEHQEQKCHAVISRYRDDNRSFRTEKAPTFFGTKWKYPRETVFESDLSPDREKLSGEIAKAEGLYPVIRSAKEEVSLAVEHFLDQLSELADPLAGSGDKGQ